MKIKKVLTVIISIILALSLASCDSLMNIVDKIIEKQESQQNNSESEQEILPDEPEEIDPNWPVTVFGTEITSAPEKVVSATPALCEYISDMGLLPKLDAVCDNCSFDEAKGFMSIGSVPLPNMETVNSIVPKYVLTFSEYDEETLIKFQQLDAEVIVIEAPKNIDSLRELYRNLALFFLGNIDGTALGESYIEKYNSALSEIEYTGEKNSAAFLRYMNNLMITSDTLAGELLSKGFNNAAAEYTGYEYPEEELKNLNPDMIFVSGRIHLEDLETSDIYKKKSAVKGDKVFYVDLDAVAVGSLRSFGIIKDMLSTAYKDYTGGTVLEPAYPSIYKK